ncbi:hydroxysqualene dehydroxylase [Nocardia arizonensis]|uniref:hydroxysqualene dehydroxylase n=1 Tax=Nocardia arizonensis TaxID=1141647 RepID=UPI0006D2C029|nr:FAD-dependent oxidoreductase [Nocardia arizonensis]
MIRGTVAMGVAAAGAQSAGAVCPVTARAEPQGPRVAVLGGGVAGLTAAHELAERGFRVTVYERRALGGKARSIPVPGTGVEGRPDLPGEHGFRFFPGFYQHIPDTMRRIPFGDNPEGVRSNLISVSEARFARRDGDDFRLLPLSPRAATAATPDAFRETVGATISSALNLPAPEGLYFANRLLVFNSSCDARRLGQWEQMPWRDFVGSRDRSHEFRALLSRTLTSLLVAAKDEIASVRTIGTMGEQFLGNPFQVGNDGPLDRVLNGPTNTVWIEPWTQRLRALGVEFVLGAEVRGLEMRDRRVSGARIVGPSGAETVTADHFVVALPAEQARTLWSRDVLAVRPELAAMDRLFVDWMTGIQFYLRRPAEISRGHTAYIDSPWSLTSISQNQLWTRKLAEYGDGTVQDCLSVDISDWNTPGVLYGKTAKECTHEEIAREVWAQMRQHLDDVDATLRDADLHSWFLDPGVTWQPDQRRNANADPLLINTIGSWDCRPETHGAIENLFLAGDYIRTNVDLATMEGANESARAAVNALLDTVGSNAPRCRVFHMYRAVELDPLRRMDEDRYAAGQPNMFDLPA